MNLKRDHPPSHPKLMHVKRSFDEQGPKDPTNTPVSVQPESISSQITNIEDVIHSVETLVGEENKTHHAQEHKQTESKMLEDKLTSSDRGYKKQGSASHSVLKVIQDDPYLKNYEKDIEYRLKKYNEWKNKFEQNEGGLLEFARTAYKNFGIHAREDGIHYQEWAPAAKELHLIGDFNNWNRTSHPCKRNEYGVWTLHLPKNADGSLPIKHGSKIKVSVTAIDGKKADKNPAWISYLLQNPESFMYDGVFWNPPTPYQWKAHIPPQPKSLRIYEAHVGMSSTEAKVNSYREFAEHVLPRIKACGYTAIQFMAIMEHSYYGSFGYHVTNFFAISSRCGTPEDLKYLIDLAHSMGIIVLMDIVHSHASMNTLDGINMFDGTDHQYFHGGKRGYHQQWDSRLFNYSSYEVLRFLLSNAAWYMDEYKFDGFRFDAVTSIMYLHHGINYSFTGNYDEYFGPRVVDHDGIAFLMLINDLIHNINPEAVTLAEDVSGMPTLCRPIKEGGVGFDYRLNMSVPDKWIELLKEIKDENWNMGNITHTLTNRRFNEKCVTYSESHDQSIVGDKTLSMWLFGKEIYTGMSVADKPTVVVDRGMALHKMIRLITYALGGEAYLNFIGNEFGHPEWVDFPRPGNNFSYQFCRRQWNLADNPSLRYKELLNFDVAMHHLEETFRWLNATSQYIVLTHEKDKIIAFEREDLLFVFNFHPFKSFEHYRIGTKWSTEHLLVLDTDSSKFGGKDRLAHGQQNMFPVVKDPWSNRPNYIQVYIPSRTALVFCAEQNFSKYDLVRPGTVHSESPPHIQNKENKTEEMIVSKEEENKKTVEKYHDEALSQEEREKAVEISPSHKYELRKEPEEDYRKEEHKSRSASFDIKNEEPV